jgi:DeoR/GlpR family transcriptional regulator of sugar metabolism
MQASMEAHEHEKVVKAIAQFDNLMKGQVIAEDAGEVVEQMRALAKEAQVMIDFLALKITTTGVIHRPQGSIVLIGNKSKQVGDFVDAANRCRLKEIHPDRLLFELDGFEIEYAMNKKK